LTNSYFSYNGFIYLAIDQHEHVKMNLRRRKFREAAIAGIDVGSLATASASGKFTAA